MLPDADPAVRQGDRQGVSQGRLGDCSDYRQPPRHASSRWTAHQHSRAWQPAAPSRNACFDLPPSRPDRRSAARPPLKWHCCHSCRFHPFRPPQHRITALMESCAHERRPDRTDGREVLAANATSSSGTAAAAWLSRSCRCARWPPPSSWRVRDQHASAAWHVDSQGVCRSLPSRLNQHVQCDDIKARDDLLRVKPHCWSRQSVGTVLLPRVR